MVLSQGKGSQIDGLRFDMIDEICGKDIGIFKVLYLCNERTKDGHKKYHIKCNFCGKEWSKHLGLGINFINRYLNKNGMENTIMFIKEKI